MLIALPAQLGYPALVILIMLESAGLPVPGETALLTAGGLVAGGRMSLPLVIVAATLAAIAGDNVGYWLGWRGGRAFAVKGRFLARHRREAFSRASRFMGRYGFATVFFGRWFPGLRFAAALTAGATAMPWRRFVIANAAGALVWATAVATLAMVAGPTGSLLLAGGGLAIGGLVLAAGWLTRGVRARRQATGRSAIPRAPVRAGRAGEAGPPGVPRRLGAAIATARAVEVIRSVSLRWTTRRLAAASLAVAGSTAGAGVHLGWEWRRAGALGRLARRYELMLWLALAAGITVALRAPWFGAHLGNDEGGLAYVASNWHGHGPFPYGDLFIDRPPLLLLIFRLATASGGTASVRTVGTMTALGLVIAVTLLARELGGRRVVPWAALLAAALGSSLAIGAVFTPAELSAALISTVSVLALVAGHRRPRSRPPLLFLAGALAVGALLCKQSFGDAGVAGAAYLAASALLERPGGRELGRRIAAYAAGVACVIVALELWERVAGFPDGTMAYSLLGFRLDGLGALAGSAGGLPGRFANRLLLPLVASGLALALVWARPGLRVLGERPVLRVTVVSWGLAGAVGVLAGGSYWSHYLIELVPFASVTAALGLAHATPLRARATAGALALLALGAVVVGPTLRAARVDDRPAPAIGRLIHDGARPTDTIYVRYSQANILYYSGLRTRYPYDWSLMLRTVPGAQDRLQALLRSSHRPTWVVPWEPGTAYGLDQNHAIGRLLTRHYRPAATVCGHPILLENGVRRSLPPTRDVCA